MLRISQASNACVRGQVSIGRCDAVAEEVLERRVRCQADGQADGFAHALGVKGVGQMPVIQRTVAHGDQGR